MSDLLREVDEVMHQERMAKIWQENRVYIIGFVLGTILLTAALSGYRSWNWSVQEKQTIEIINLQEAESYPQNILDNDNLDLRPNLKAIALMNAAGTFIEQEKPDQAATLFDRVVQDSKSPSDLSHLAAIMATRLLIDKPDQTGEALIKKLQPVLSTPKSPWFNHARLEAAVIRAEKLNDIPTALKHLDAIQNDETAQQSLRERASALAHIYKTKTQ